MYSAPTYVRELLLSVYTCGRSTVSRRKEKVRMEEDFFCNDGEAEKRQK